MSLSGTKSIFTSKTFWGSLIAMLAVIFPNFLSIVGIDDPSMIAEKIVGAIGAALAIYGRLFATQTTTITGS